MNIKKYFDFQGKVSRSEYWTTLVVGFIAFIIAAVVIGAAAGVMIVLLGAQIVDSDRTGAVISFPLFVVLIWVWLATGIKRCRDADISPLWLIASCFPVLSFITIIVIGVMPTKKDSNVA